MVGDRELERNKLRFVSATVYEKKAMVKAVPVESEVSGVVRKRRRSTYGVTEMREAVMRRSRGEIGQCGVNRDSLAYDGDSEAATDYVRLRWIVEVAVWECFSLSLIARVLFRSQILGVAARCAPGFLDIMHPVGDDPRIADGCCRSLSWSRLH